MSDSSRRPYIPPAFTRLEPEAMRDISTRDFLRLMTGLLPVLEELIDAAMANPEIADMPLGEAVGRLR